MEEMEERKSILNSNKKEALKVGKLTFRSFYDFETNESDLKLARLELGETEEIKAVSLLKLKDTLTDDNDFHYRLDDEYLLRFLRYRKYNVKKTYAIVRNFYEFRKERPDLFDVATNIDFFLKRDIIRVLPYREEEGSTVFWIDTNNWKLDETSVWDILRITHTFGDVITMNPGIQIQGFIGLWDIGGLTATHMAYISNPAVIRILLKTLQSLYPWRIKRVILFNSNPILRIAYNGIRYFLKKKVADRVIILGSDVKEIHKYLNPRILPQKYGGCIEESECSVAQYLKDNMPYIKYERSFGANKQV